MAVELRRPRRYNKPSYPNVYYRGVILEEVETTLYRIGGENLVGQFKQGPFGQFLGWCPGSSYAQALHSIVCRAVNWDRNLTFFIRGRCIEYTMQDHALVTGLLFGTTNFDPTLGYEAMESRLCAAVCGDHCKTAKQLRKDFNLDPSPFADDDGQIHLQLANLLIANIFILGHDDESKPFPWLWHLADDQQAFASFPWGAYSYMTLLHYLKHTQDKPRYHFYGPAWALIVWGFEVIGGLGDMAGTVYDDDLYPRCLRWHFNTRLEGTTDREFYSMLDDVTLPLQNILPTDIEYGYEYYRSSLLPSALDVYFNVPTSASEGRHEHRRGPRPRQPMHDPEVDIIDVEGSRPRRSTQSTVFYGEDVAETIGSGSCQPRHRRDPGKRAREAFSSRNRGDDSAPHVTQGQVREIVREVVREEMKGVREEIKGVADKLKTYYEDLKALFSCRSSRRSSPVYEPRRMSPPIPSSACDSGVAHAAGTSGIGAQDPILDHVDDVGGRRDTTLPLYTVASSDPSTGLADFGSFTNQAFTSVFGQSSFIPPFGVPYHPSLDNTPREPHRYSMPEIPGSTYEFPTPSSAFPMSSAPFVTIRDPARASASVLETGQVLYNYD